MAEKYKEDELTEVLIPKGENTRDNADNLGNLTYDSGQESYLRESLNHKNNSTKHGKKHQTENNKEAKTDKDGYNSPTTPHKKRLVHFSVK